MKETTYTPVPWISGSLGTSATDETIAYVRSVASSPVDAMLGEPYICICCREENAAFIVRACNSFEDLLDFVKTLENDNGNIPAWLWDKRNALIAKAEGRDQ